MTRQNTTIQITRTEALVLQDILRHIHTSNGAVIEATFQIFQSLQNRLDTPVKPCDCRTSNG